MTSSAAAEDLLHSRNNPYLPPAAAAAASACDQQWHRIRRRRRLQGYVSAAAVAAAYVTTTPHSAASDAASKQTHPRQLRPLLHKNNGKTCTFDSAHNYNLLPLQRHRYSTDDHDVPQPLPLPSRTRRRRRLQITPTTSSGNNTKTLQEQHQQHDIHCSTNTTITQHTDQDQHAPAAVPRTTSITTTPETKTANNKHVTHHSSSDKNTPTDVKHEYLRGAAAPKRSPLTTTQARRHQSSEKLRQTTAKRTGAARRRKANQWRAREAMTAKQHRRRQQEDRNTQRAATQHQHSMQKQDDRTGNRDERATATVDAEAAGITITAKAMMTTPTPDAPRCHNTIPTTRNGFAPRKKQTREDENEEEMAIFVPPVDCSTSMEDVQATNGAVAPSTIASLQSMTTLLSADTAALVVDLTPQVKLPLLQRQDVTRRRNRKRNRTITSRRQMELLSVAPEGAVLVAAAAMDPEYAGAYTRKRKRARGLCIHLNDSGAEEEGKNEEAELAIMDIYSNRVSASLAKDLRAFNYGNWLRPCPVPDLSLSGETEYAAYWADARLRCFDKAWFQGLYCADFGCGTGALTTSIARKFACKHMLGIDLCPLAVEEARARAAELTGVLRQRGEANEVKEDNVVCATNLDSKFPNNLVFVCADVLCTNLVQWGIRKPLDTVLCLRLTKWVHLNGGDAALRQLFVTFAVSLRVGGLLVLEAHERSSYARCRTRSERFRANYASLRLRPEDFARELEALGFVFVRTMYRNGTSVPTVDGDGITHVGDTGDDDVELLERSSSNMKSAAEPPQKWGRRQKQRQARPIWVFRKGEPCAATQNKKLRKNG